MPAKAPRFPSEAKFKAWLKKHPTDGEPGYGDRCPLALAIRAKTGRKGWVDEHSFSYDMEEWMRAEGIATPPWAAVFIDRFDGQGASQ